MKTKELKINIPEGYEIDKENSTFDCIKLKPIKEIGIWKDIYKIKGVHIDLESNITKIDNEIFVLDYCQNVFIDERHAKSSLAMAQISQLMPYYGGAITDEQWKESSDKFAISSFENNIYTLECRNEKRFLAFHEKEQIDKFMSYPENVQLVKDYLMID